jgi:3-dehydroquinate synthase
LPKKAVTSISVQLDNRSYPIDVGADILKTLPTYLIEHKVGKKVFLITDENVAPLYGRNLESVLSKNNYSVTFIVLPQGESQKSFKNVSSLLDQILELKVERNDSVVALGGGVIGDLAGFVASLCLRGINLFQIPTSLLAQVDACIGGKTAVNHSTGKNLIGSFYQPKLTLIDLDCLDTLPKHELKCGMAEIVKYGIIKNVELFHFIESNIKDIAEFTPKKHSAIWRHLIESSANDKAEVVSNDEREAGLRETLNFGHTIGHAIESAYAYGTFSHGEAVALGMISACEISVHLNLMAQDISDRIETLLKELGFGTKIPTIPIEKLLIPMESDKKVKNGKIRFILASEIGKTETRNDVPRELVKSAIQSLFK